MITARNGSNTKNMDKGFGGKQQRMGMSRIHAQKGYLGPCTIILETGNKQTIIFGEGNVGQQWIKLDEQIQLKYDTYTNWISERNKMQQRIIDSIAIQHMLSSTAWHSY